MSIPLITSALARALRRLLQALLRRIQEDDSAIEPVYVILEHWLLEVLETADFEYALNEAQEEFSGYMASHERWLTFFASLFEYGGEAVEPFAENIWKAYLFRSQVAADQLWDQYPIIQQAVTVETGRALPTSWGEWVLWLQSFMGVVERHFITQNAIFDDLFVSDEILDLLEEMPIVEPETTRQPVIDLPAFEPGAFSRATLMAYLTACGERIGHIDPRGYPSSVQTSVPLSDVYIPLRVVPVAACGRPMQYVRYRTAGYDDVELDMFGQPLGYHELDEHPGLAINDVLNREPLLVFLGKAGAGKTTLVRHLLHEHVRILLDDESTSLTSEPGSSNGLRIQLACLLPIYVDLADFVENHDDDESLEAFLLRSVADLTQNDDVVDMISLLLENGQCLILLDGLSQTAVDEQRRMVVSEVGHAALDWRAHGNRVVVTSRFAGYPTIPLPRGFEGYIVKPLDRGQINSFLMRWRLTLARMQRPLVNDDEVLRQAQADTLALSRLVTSNPRLSMMVDTPLLLRMLVGVFYQGMTFSPQRVAIYQQVADALIREWRLPQSATHRPQVLEQEAGALLGELAFWLQASRPTGMITEREMSEILARVWSEMHSEATPEQVHTAVGDFIGKMRLYSGVIIELSPQRYGFVYHSLQEYFAARYMVSSFRLAPQRIRDRLHDPRWDEVIALAIGLVSLRSPDDASDLIETSILARGDRAAQFGHASSPFESLLKRDLLFAAHLLGTGVEARSSLTSEVVRQLMDLWLYGERDSLGRFSLIFDRVRRTLVNLDGTSASHHALQIAMEAIDAPDEHTQAFAVDALTFWPTHLEEARDVLVAHGREAPQLVRRAIAEALGRVGSLSREAYTLLLMFTADPDEVISEIAQRTLEQSPPVPYEVVSMWVEYLHSDDPVHRRVSLRRLQQAGSLPPVVINELLNLLDDEDEMTRRRAVDTLASVANLPDDALTVICRAIANADPSVRVAAISALARPVELPQEVIEHLIRWTDDPDVGVRHAATLALGSCKNTTPEVIGALIERFNDAVDSVRAAVVEPLAIKGQDYSRAIHMLASHAVSDPIYQVRCAVAAALRHIPAPNADLRHALYTLLSDSQTIVRETALETVACLTQPGQEIIDYLIAVVGIPDHPVGAKATLTLAALRDLPDEALLALVQALRTNWEAAGPQIVDCLRAHVPLAPEVVNEVMDLAVLSETGTVSLRRAASGMRTCALEILGYTLDETPANMQILFDAVAPLENIGVRIAALRGMAYARTAGLSVFGLLRELVKTGPIDIRCAAGIALGRLIRNIPDPPLSSDEILEMARDVSDLLMSLPPRAAWEADSQAQNELLWALSWIVMRARPKIPQLPSRGLENPRRDFDE